MEITISLDGTLHDFMINRKQKVSDTLQILEESAVFRMENDMEYKVFSERKKEWIDTTVTYEQAGIFTGDILKLEGVAKDETEV